MRKGPLCPESLSCQKKDGHAHPSFGMTPTFEIFFDFFYLFILFIHLFIFFFLKS